MKIFIKYKLISITSLYFLPKILFAAVVGAGGGGIQNPISFNTISDFIAAILEVIVKIGIPIAAIFIIYAGFLFVTARGNEKQIEKAKYAFIWTTIGTAILLGASIFADIISTTINNLT